jgi:hypothetical protein
MSLSSGGEKGGKESKGQAWRLGGVVETWMHPLSGPALHTPSRLLTNLLHLVSIIHPEKFSDLLEALLSRTTESVPTLLWATLCTAGPGIL